jgi:hypothetical protein
MGNEGMGRDSMWVMLTWCFLNMSKALPSWPAVESRSKLNTGKAGKRESGKVGKWESEPGK